MNFVDVVFYLFATITLLAGVGVVVARNPVHAALFLVLAFCSGAGIWMLLEAEFLAIALILVYVGAVMVLFLFVVMMLDINFAELRSGYQRYLPVGLAVGAVLLTELAIVLGGWKVSPEAVTLRLSPRAAELHNTLQLGRLIYTDYIFLFQAAGLVLLVAMIGAIVLTLRDRTKSRHQNIAHQIARTPADTLELVDVPSRAGVASIGILRPKPAPQPEQAEASTGHAEGHH